MELENEIARLWARFWSLTDPRLMQQCLAYIARAMELQIYNK